MFASHGECFAMIIYKVVKWLERRKLFGFQQDFVLGGPFWKVWEVMQAFHPRAVVQNKKWVLMRTPVSQKSKGLN